MAEEHTPVALVASWEVAALFFGAAAQVAEETGLDASPPDVAFVASTIRRVQAAMGPPAFAAAEAAGRVLGYEQAVARARAWLGQQQG